MQILLNKVSKNFEDNTILENIETKIKKDDYIFLVGKNGSGKTTLFYLITRIIPVTSGRISRFPTNLSVELFTSSNMFYWDLTAIQNLQFFANICGVPTLKTNILDTLEYVGIKNNSHVIVRNFSKGMLQRLKIAKLLINKPNFVLFDEPYDSLDIQGRKLLYNILINKGCKQFSWKIHAFVIVEHSFYKIENICNQIWFLNNQQLIYNKNNVSNRKKIQKFLYEN